MIENPRDMIGPVKDYREFSTDDEKRWPLPRSFGRWVYDNADYLGYIFTILLVGCLLVWNRS